jgi:hypothetical protein
MDHNTQPEGDAVSRRLGRDAYVHIGTTRKLIKLRQSDMFIEEARATGTSSDIHVMLHVNRREGFTMAVSAG